MTTEESIARYGERLQSIGAYFKAAMKKYFNQEITIGIIRKVMETAVSECSLFNSAIRDNLSMAMLHDPETARRYYVCKDSEEASKTINVQWQRFSWASPTKQQSVVPSLVASPSRDDNSEQAEDVREIANSIASNLVPAAQPTKPQSNFRTLQRPGDWPCSFCGYINFSYRAVCNRCGKAKNKRSAYEEPEQKQKKARSGSDITEVLSKSTI